MNIINKLLNFIKTHTKIYLLALLGCFSLLCMLYIRFIRERLPQNIPFVLTEFRFYSLLFICFSFLYIIKLYLKPKAANEYMVKIFSYIGLPFVTFDNLLKTNDYSLSHIKSLIKHSYPKKHMTQIYIIISLQIIPKTILLFVFLLDVFYFRKLCYFYMIIGIGILPWLYFYHKYSMYHAKQLGISYLEANYNNVYVCEKGWDEPTIEYEYDENDNLQENRIAPEWKPHPKNKYHEIMITVKEYFEILLEKDINDALNDDYSIDDDYDFDPSALSKDYRYQQYKEITGKTKLEEEDFIILHADFNELAPIIQNLNSHLHFLPNVEKKYYMLTINFFISIIWLFVWSYILLISISSLSDLPITLQVLKLLSINDNEMNPFLYP